MNIAVACQSPLSYFSWICADMWKTFANLQKSRTLNNLCDSRRIFDNSWESLIILKDPGCDIPQGSFRCFGILGRQSPDGLSILIGWIEALKLLGRSASGIGAFRVGLIPGRDDSHAGADFGLGPPVAAKRISCVVPLVASRQGEINTEFKVLIR